MYLHNIVRHCFTDNSSDNTSSKSFQIMWSSPAAAAMTVIPNNLHNSTTDNHQIQLMVAVHIALGSTIDLGEIDWPSTSSDDTLSGNFTSLKSDLIDKLCSTNLGNGSIGRASVGGHLVYIVPPSALKIAIPDFILLTSTIKVKELWSNIHKFKEKGTKVK